MHMLVLPLVIIGTSLAGIAGAQSVNRCEGTDGRVTYTNEPCPSTARKARTVDDSPPVLAPRDRVAKAEDAKPEAAKPESAKPEAAKPDEAAKSGEPKAAGKAPESGITKSGRVQTASTPSNLTPAQQMEQLDQERARQRRLCADLERSVAFARRDVDTALGGQRASAELQLRRVQEDYLAQCPRQR